MKNFAMVCKKINDLNVKAEKLMDKSCEAGFAGNDDLADELERKSDEASNEAWEMAKKAAKELLPMLLTVNEKMTEKGAAIMIFQNAGKLCKA